MKKVILIFVLFLSIQSFAQNAPNQLLTVHEWGTFTARYDHLSRPYLNVHKTVDEPVPAFVYHLDFDSTYYNGYPGYEKTQYYFRGFLKIDDLVSSIKMETPVLYFYCSKGVENLGVSVKFKTGSISEFYPKPVKQEDTSLFRSNVGFNSQEQTVLSFRKYNGFASWNIDVLPPRDITPLSHSDDSVPNMWLAPRKTNSNLIKSNGEVEKYIFYRGLGGFDNPVIPRYTDQGNLLVTNNTDSIPYALVYEKTKEGKIYIWGVKSLPQNKSIFFERSTFAITEAEWNEKYRKQFVNYLVDAGLYEDEALAMLNTWDASYFGKSGLKIFWIVPRNFTDTILPIEFSKPVANLERVMIGRTEIDEYNKFDNGFMVSDLKARQTEEWNENQNFQFFPNPASKVISLKSDYFLPQIVEVEILDFSGNLIRTESVRLLPAFSTQINVGDLETGMYLFRVKDKSESTRIFVTKE
ncbi:MAG: T9SS type A sorting domain-containing protein [Flavobacteriales bacterium]|nr:T9SS type A sorting domain-containing protein [Flavobacteriales bacterium]